MSLSSLNSIEQSVFELESGNQNVDGQTDRQTDVGHINLIGGKSQYGEKPYRRTALHFLMSVEKSPIPFWETLEKSPTLIS